MALTPKEVEESIDPVYKDTYVSIYGIPIFPHSTDTMQVDASLKRKRSPSPQLPSKKLVTETGPVPVKDKTLAQLMEDDESFVPSKLEGQAADDWRRLVVRTMFPYAGLKTKPKNEHDVIYGSRLEVQAGDARVSLVFLPQIRVQDIFSGPTSTPPTKLTLFRTDAASPKGCVRGQLLTLHATFHGVCRCRSSNPRQV